MAACPTPSVAVAAADEGARRRIAAALTAGGLEPASALADAEAVAADGSAPDVLVVACTKGIVRRRELVARTRRRLPETRLVLIGPADSGGGVRAVVEAGAHGVVFDAELERTLGPTVLAVAVGQAAVPAERRRELGHPSLSSREREILALVVEGLANKEIAARLYLTESTVKCHLSSVFQKLGVRSRNEAASLVLASQHPLGLAMVKDPAAEPGQHGGPR